MSLADRVSSGATTIGHLGTPAAIAALVLCGVLVAGCQVAPQPGPPSSDPRVVTREPLEAALFLEAWARGDEETVDQVASRLYEAEWARRGVAPGGRRDQWAEGSPRDPLAFVGGVLDEARFGHHLYLSTPGGRSRPDQPAPAVWRVDTDPTGGVVWVERVWLFRGDTWVITTVGGMIGQAGLVPASLRVLRPEPLIRIASDTTQESYDLIRIGSAGGLLAFYGTDETGAVVDGVWSYGQPVQGWGATPRRWHGAGPRARTGGDDLEAAYLASLLPGS
jgi:hypothetical protein